MQGHVTLPTPPALASQRLLGIILSCEIEMIRRPRRSENEE